MKTVCLGSAYVMSAQCSYDPRFLKRNIPGDAWKHPYMPPFFGMTPAEYETAENAPPEKLKLFEEASPINFASADDPPVVLAYGARTPLSDKTPAGVAMHHPAFGDLLKRKADPLKLDCTVRCDEHMFTSRPRLEFFAKHLLGPQPASRPAQPPAKDDPKQNALPTAPATAASAAACAGGPSA